MLGQQKRNKCSNIYYRQCIVNLLLYKSCNVIVISYSKQLEYVIGPYRKLIHFTGRIISVEFLKIISTKNMAHLSFFMHILCMLQLITNSMSYNICHDLQRSEILIRIHALLLQLECLKYFCIGLNISLALEKISIQFMLLICCVLKLLQIRYPFWNEKLTEIIWLCCNS